MNQYDIQDNALLDTFAAECDARYNVEYTVDTVTGERVVLKFNDMVEAVAKARVFALKGQKVRVGAWGMTLCTLQDTMVVHLTNHRYIKNFRTYWGR